MEFYIVKLDKKHIKGHKISAIADILISRKPFMFMLRLI